MDDGLRLRAIKEILGVFGPLIHACQEETPVFDVQGAANKYLAAAGIPFRYEWNQDEWRYDVMMAKRE